MSFLEGRKEGIAEEMCLVLVPTFDAASSLVFCLTHAFVMYAIENKYYST